MSEAAETTESHDLNSVFGSQAKPANDVKPTEAEQAVVTEAKPANDTGEPADPLSLELFSAEKLKTPEDFAAAVKRIQDEIAKANELKRKSHRAHGAAESRAKKLATKEAQIQERETRAAAFERMASAAINDLESGDAERFLTAVGKLTKSGDPASFWRNATLSLAKGEKFKPAEQAKIDADPELRKEVGQLKQYVEAEQERRENLMIEQAKTRNYEVAKANEATPLVQAWATEYPDHARKGIAAVMVEEYNRTGTSIDIHTACRIIEENLQIQYELSQRASGQTNGEKGTTGSVPEAGREPSKATPKPETVATIPASLGSSPASANRSLNEEEKRAAQIRLLEAAGFF